MTAVVAWLAETRQESDTLSKRRYSLKSQCHSSHVLPFSWLQVCRFVGL
jgi:hypothetical protein